MTQAVPLRALAIAHGNQSSVIYHQPAPPGQPADHLLPLSHPAKYICLPGDTKHPSYVPLNNQNFMMFLVPLPCSPRITLCVNNLDAQNLIRVIIHCDSGFRAPKHLPTGSVNMVALNSVPQFWRRFFGLQWKEIAQMFAVRLAVGSQPYAHRPGTVAQWMTAVESIWLADRGGFYGAERLPAANYQKGADLVVVLLCYVHGGNAAGFAKTSVNFRFSCKSDDARRDWAEMEAGVGMPAVVILLSGERDHWMQGMPPTINAGNFAVRWGILELCTGRHWQGELHRSATR
ncbi:hypothetical protein FN846DRAFT_913636 [Sphaerosporella brunnea]|uniref:Uncharacterized protein n=1 Tax=Sphaerosporella brunnea TaxID=1250544 RepID=A0A5J5EFN1_9PEZI|nr:hypothetical protein FN846DRAFT_913636 [Sphaerosporella brunnea]